MSMQTDPTLTRYRKRLHLSAISFAACFAALIYHVGGQEFFYLAKASFEKPVCCIHIHRTRNPLDPQR